MNFWKITIIGLVALSAQASHAATTASINLECSQISGTKIAEAKEGDEAPSTSPTETPKSGQKKSGYMTRPENGFPDRAGGPPDGMPPGGPPPGGFSGRFPGGPPN
jgi:hypothetical protein